MIAVWESSDQLAFQSRNRESIGLMLPWTETALRVSPYEFRI